MNYISSMYHELLRLQSRPRQLKFEFPLRVFSCSRGLAAGQISRRREADLEFCIRLSSTEKESVDWLDGECYHTPFPFLLIRKPDCLQRVRIDGIREALSLYYDRSLMQRFIDAGFDLTLPGRPFTRTPEIDELTTKLRRLIGLIELPGMVEKIDQLAFMLLTTIFLQPRNINGEVGTISGEEEMMRRIASYFQLHLADRINLDDVLRRFGISRRSFFRHWQQYYSEPPAQYIRNLRFTDAMRQLEGTSEPTEVIIRNCGFPDRTLFYRLFRERYGMTPNEYREKNVIKNHPIH
jgi:AraC-like DNA-binding protein